MLYLNGKIISADEATIRPDDRGFLLGDGIFETLRCDAGQPVALADHWQRMKKGADYLDIPFSMTVDELKKIIVQLASDKTCGIRITLTRGPQPRGLMPAAETRPTILIQSFPLATNTEALRTTISEVSINERSPLCRFKTTNYLEKIVALQQARKKGFDDAILLNTQNKIVSTTTANIFFVQQNKVFTPPLSDGALPGITRAQIPFEEKSFTVSDLALCEEIFITNSLIQIKPLQAIAEHWQSKQTVWAEKLRSLLFK